MKGNKLDLKQGEQMSRIKVKPNFNWNPFSGWKNPLDSIQDFLDDIQDVILGPMKDLLLVAGVSMGIILFFTTYHRKAIAAGAKHAGTMAVQYGREAAPLLLV